MNYLFNNKKIRLYRVVINIALSAFLLIPVLFSACGQSNGGSSSVSGNLSEAVLEPGDIYAVIDINGYGEITFKLFPDIAPVAVEHFIALAEKGYYDSKNIHRVVKDFVTQGGSLYGDGTDGEIQSGEGFEIETSDKARNFYGALCMAANEENINCYQFYIINNKSAVDIDADISAVQEILGNTEKELKAEAKERYENYLAQLKAIPDNVKELYKSRGGVFRLDGTNTVFGQMIEGANVIDAISAAEVVYGNQIDDAGNIQSKPLEPIIINTVKIVRIPLPEPTTAETTEETTKKSKKSKTKAVTDDSPQLTEVVAFGETTTAPEDDSENLNTVSADNNTNTETQENTDINENSDNADTISEPAEDADINEISNNTDVIIEPEEDIDIPVDDNIPDETGEGVSDSTE